MTFVTVDNLTDLALKRCSTAHSPRLAELMTVLIRHLHAYTPGIADDPRFLHDADRTERRAQLRPLLVERLRTRPALEWLELLVDAGVPCGPINTIDGGFAMAERFGLEPVVDVGEGDRAVPATRHPIRFSESPAVYRLPPPELDEHGAELRKWLERDPRGDGTEDDDA